MRRAGIRSANEERAHSVTPDRDDWTRPGTRSRY
jgi:hypothetical protein